MSGAGRAGGFDQRRLAEEAPEVGSLPQARHGRVRERFSQLRIIYIYLSIYLYMSIDVYGSIDVRTWIYSP